MDREKWRSEEGGGEADRVRGKKDDRERRRTERGVHTCTYRIGHTVL